MTFPIIPASTVSGGYRISRSLRFRSSASAYLSRTPGSASTDAKKFSFSWWTKKAKVATANQFVYGCGSSGSDETYFGFNSTDKFEYIEYTSSAYQINVSTTPVYRDPSAWYHCLLVLDTTQGASSDRVKFYVNSVQQTLTGTFPGLNYATSNVNSTDAQNINRLPTSGAVNFDGYYAEVYMIDGQALTPSSFGAYDTNGVWQPKAYTGTYGTNGFYLNFSDNSGATATTIGKDSSGNSNNWTPNGISVATGTTYDSMIDSPTNYADGGNGRGNYAVLNPLDKTTNATITNGNLKIRSAALGSNQFSRATMTMPASNIYFEGTAGANTGIALVSELGLMETIGSYAGVRSGVQCTNGNFYSVANGVYTSLGVGGISAGTVIGLAYDLVNYKMAIYKDGVSLASNISISSSYISPMAHVYQDASGDVGWEVNFGQQPFRYSPPSGYTALNTQNLPAPTVPNGASYMAATTYTGNGGTQSITNGGNNNTGVTFQPDFVWIKARQGVIQNILTDAVRGVSKQLCSDTTAAEVAYTNLQLTAFNSDGFTVIDAANGGYGVNGSAGGTYSGASAFYIGWQWKGGNGTVSNTSGSITSTVSANTSAGFSVVTWTGSTSSSNQTVGHGLGVTPSLVILKNRNFVDGWYVWSSTFANTTTDYLVLNTTAAKATAAGTIWGAGMTSSLCGVRPSTFCSASTDSVVMYCFAPVAGYSAFGSYTGNGSTDGPFVYTGFRPRWIMVKRSDAAAGWYMEDTSRNTYNVMDKYLTAESSDAESTLSTIDSLSNGFKIRASSTGFNASGGTYIYAAFCEHPFKFSRSR